MKKELKIHYGSGELKFSIPEKNLQDYIIPRVTENYIDADSVFRDENNADLLKSAVTGKSVCILSEDSTRNTPTHAMIEDILPLFSPARQLIIIIATGSHASDSPENTELKRRYELAAKRAGLTGAVVHVHDCEKDRYKLYGITRKGTPALANTLIDDIEVFFTFSDMKIHYFAGFSNPVKLVFPGIVHYDAIERNHAFALDKRSTTGMHPLHPDPARRDNPLAADMLEAFRMIVQNRPVYSLCAVSYHKQLVWVRFGILESTVPDAMREVDAISRFTVRPADRIIVSPGGHPDDESLYIAQRALELTKTAVKPGGEILFLAECRNGIGPERTIENFYNRLKAPIEDILKDISSDYKLFTHKPYKFAQLMNGLRQISMVTSLDKDIVEDIHLRKTSGPQEVIDTWLRDNPEAAISVFDGANKLAVYGESS